MQRSGRPSPRRSASAHGREKPDATDWRSRSPAPGRQSPTPRLVSREAVVTPLVVTGFPSPTIFAPPIGQIYRTSATGSPGRAFPPELTLWIFTRRPMESRIEHLCVERGVKMTGQRRVIARVLSDADDHPDVEELYRRASALDSHISI